jgi:hypothetical protein
VNPNDYWGVLLALVILTIVVLSVLREVCILRVIVKAIRNGESIDRRVLGTRVRVTIKGRDES